MLESRPVERPQRERHEADANVRRNVPSRRRESRRWEQSYGGPRSDSHRWLRFR